MLKNPIFKTIIMTISTFFFLLLIGNVSANPLPITNYGSGTPIADVFNENISIQFVSEEVTYIIDGSNDAQVVASYVFRNPTNNSVEQCIAIPFKVGIPYEIAIYANDILIFNYTEPHNNDFRIEFNGTSYSSVFFNVEFKENETITLKAIYPERYALPPELFDNPFFNSKSCTYIAKTGSAWNDTINATFTFKINKNMLPIGLSGFDIFDDGAYIVATKSYTNWIPDRDIKIEWTVINIPCLLVVIIPIILIILIIIIRRKKKLNKQNTK